MELSIIGYWLLVCLKSEIIASLVPRAPSPWFPEKPWEKLQHATFAGDDHFTNGMQPSDK
jgi:hypothetical protein